MPKIMTLAAEEIAAKLARETPQKPRRSAFRVTVHDGGKHRRVKIWYGEKWIGQYGIQRGSKQQGHNYIAEQLYLTLQQTYYLAKCSFSVDDYVDALIVRGEIPKPSEP